MWDTSYKIGNILEFLRNHILYIVDRMKKKRNIFWKQVKKGKEQFVIYPW